MLIRNIGVVILLLVIGLFSCKEDSAKKVNDKTEIQPAKKKAIIPAIQADSAYYFIEKQLSFGTRVPGSEGHKAMKDWLVSTLKSMGLTVVVQEFKADFLGKKGVQSYNIIASLNPDHKQRMIIAAHWDTRLIAEKDSDESMRDKPIMGADDGGSGVAGLLEIARTMILNPIDLGVDFIFFDAEDQGENSITESWCLGAQYWSKNPHIKGYTADWGILLDLMGAKDAKFHKEGVSMYFAASWMDKVWALAQNMGYGKYFINQKIGDIVDDHFYVNRDAKIPMIDIIHTNPSGNFGHYHHTHKDNIDIIDKNTLKAVIQVVTAAAYKYSDGSL